MMSIAETYRAMSADIRRSAENTQEKHFRRAYLALADMWWARAVQLDADDYRAPRAPQFNEQEKEQAAYGAGAMSN